MAVFYVQILCLGEKHCNPRRYDSAILREVKKRIRQAEGNTSKKFER
jgi:hypothetical protein